VLSAYLSWTAILRSREHYADVRALAVDGPTSALAAILARLPASAVSFWRRPTLTHASGAERLRVLEDPSPLLKVGFWDAFASGTAGALAFVGLQAYLSPPLSGTWAAGWSTAIASAAFLPLAGGVVGLGIWRSTFASLLGGERQSLARLAVGLWLGLLAGRALSYEAGVLATPLALDAPGLVPGLVLAGPLLVTLLYFAHWARNASTSWLAVALMDSRPRLPYAVGLLAGGMLSLWLAVLFLVVGTIPAADVGSVLLLAGLGLLFQLPMDPLALVGVIALWACPLAPYLRRRGTTAIAPPEWAFLDGTRPDELRIARPAPGLRRAAWIGVVGGLLSGGLLLVLVLLLSPGDAPTTEEAGTAFLVVQLGWVAVSQAAIAAVAASGAGQLRVERGLLAAFVAACLQALFRVGYSFAAFGPSLGEAWFFLSYVVVLGALFALPAAGLASALAGLREPREHGLSTRLAG
jgi:hypothetical protein